MSYNNNSHMEFNPLEAIRRRKWQLAGCLLLICALSAATVTVFAPKYQSVAQVKVIDEKPSQNTYAGIFGGGSSNFNSHYELLKSDRVYEMALARLNSDPTITSPVNMKDLRQNSKLYGDHQSNIIKITGVSDKAAASSAIANVLASSFVETSTIIKKAQDNEVLNQLTDQLLMMEEKVSAKESELEKFCQANMIIGELTSYESARAVLKNLETKLQKCDSEKVDIQSELAVLQKITIDDLQDPQAIPLDAVRNDATLKKHISDINLLSLKEREYSQIYLPDHRELQRIRQKITLAQDNMVRYAQTLLISLQKKNVEKLAALEKEKVQINTEIENNTERALSDSQLYAKHNKLKEELQEVTKLRNKIHTQMQDFKLNRELSCDPVVVVNSARIPEETAGLPARKRAGMVLVLGVLFSLVLILALEKMSINDKMANQYPFPMPYYQYQQPAPAYNQGFQTTLAAQQQAEPATNHRTEILAKISAVNLEENQGNVSDTMMYKLVHTYPNSQLAGQFRNVSTSLLSRFGKTRQSIVITGNENKCGKTILTCNLALLLAQTGRSVLIVSTNQDNDKLSKVFDTGRTLYADLMLTNQYNIDEFIRNNDSDGVATLKLDLANRPDTTELAQSLAALNGKLQSKFDWVIYDTTAIGYFDTDNILQVIGKAVFVSRSTCTGDIIMTTEQIEQRGAVSLGCVEMPVNHSANINYQPV